MRNNPEERSSHSRLCLPNGTSVSQHTEGFGNTCCNANAGDKNSYGIVRRNTNTGDQGLKNKAIDKNQLWGGG